MKKSKNGVWRRTRAAHDHKPRRLLGMQPGLQVPHERTLSSNQVRRALGLGHVDEQHSPHENFQEATTQ
jgi:hypothetical protein